MTGPGRGIVAIALLAAPAHQVSASTLCEQLQAFIADSSHGALHLASAESCGQTLTQTGDPAYHCQWSHSFRSDAAQAAFDDLGETVAACFPAAKAVRDQPVNHPDFYDLRSYDLGGTELALSLKDKAALGKTFVFLHVRPSP